MASETQTPKPPSNVIAQLEQRSSQSVRHWGTKAPSWCPTCKRSNNWLPLEAENKHRRTCYACGIKWETVGSKLQVVEEGVRNEMDFACKIVGFVKANHGPKLVNEDKLKIGKVVLLKSVVFHNSLRDTIKSTMTVLEVF